jgi:hypothetical protein
VHRLDLSSMYHSCAFRLKGLDPLISQSSLKVSRASRPKLALARKRETLYLRHSAVWYFKCYSPSCDAMLRVAQSLARCSAFSKGAWERSLPQFFARVLSAAFHLRPSVHPMRRTRTTCKQLNELCATIFGRCAEKPELNSRRARVYYSKHVGFMCWLATFLIFGTCWLAVSTMTVEW